MKEVRLLLIFIIGALLIGVTYSSQFRVSIGDALIWLLLVGIGILFFIWIIIKDIQLFIAEKRVQNFTLTFLCLIVAFSIFLVDVNIQRNFNKPTLLKVFHDGDFNGSAIDFKKDGTYIFDNSTIGLSDYTYGKYHINGNKITLDKSNIDAIKNLKHLEIREKKMDDRDSTKGELYLFQVDDNGTIIESGLTYRVTIDNRK